MSFVKLSKCPSNPETPSFHHVRPRFPHNHTHDRNREGSDRHPSLSLMTGKIKKGRKSVFKELDIDSDQPFHHYPGEREFGEITGLRIDNESDDGTSYRQSGSIKSPTTPTSPSSGRPWYSKLTPGRRPRISSTASAPPPGMSSFTRLTTLALFIAVVIPGFSYYNGREKVSLSGADAGVIREVVQPSGPILETRTDSSTDYCARWAGQSASVNGTLYLYGGQSKTSPDQTTDTWNNDFYVLDLTKSWDTGSPRLRGLPRPSGPPAVSLGYLWNDYNNLYLYGGEFADNPYVEPAEESVWKYDIKNQKWTEYKQPKTSAGKYSTQGDLLVQRSAEGSGISVPELGLSWYFGGHLDLATTPGWSNQISRVYLKSLLEFTHPGYNNEAVYGLEDRGAGEWGAFRNITEGGLQTNQAFHERADGALVYVPGWGEKGILIGLAGGTAEEFSDNLEVLDVYDIASSEWYHQKTSGDAPSVRVNLCAVIASAQDFSSFQIYVFGGQNLQPAKSQTQYSDMYILSIPSFTWVKVSDDDNEHKPSARAGHACHLRDGQMIVVGGYTGGNTCDSPGIYVFNATSLTWQPSFKALNHDPDLHPENSVLGNSFGYQVPAPVASIIGGSGSGGATATQPAAGSATAGPFATGKSPVLTVTTTAWGPGATTTAAPGDPSDPNTETTGKDRKAGLIAAGVIAGLLGLLAIYLGYCAWLYRRQVRAYKTYLAVLNRYSTPHHPGASTASGLAAFFGFGSVGRKTSKQSRKSAVTDPLNSNGAAAASNRPISLHSSISYSSNNHGYGGIPSMEPKMLFEDGGGGNDPQSHESGYGSSRTSHTASRGGGSNNLPRPSLGSSTHAQYPPIPPVPKLAAGAASSGVGGGGGVISSFGTPGSSPWTEVSLSAGLGSGTGTTPATLSSDPSPVPGKVIDAHEEDLAGDGGEFYDEGRGSVSSTERLLEGVEPSFFSVVMRPRRALRVVNGLEEELDEKNGGGVQRGGGQTTRGS
ncbi:hypothetical protein GE21DRAFT_6407 [Neurospora crassa]|uniref:Kelch repeat protein n=1 Tax=Neurospora crassa (strain ATCC 24698 / 74-OR23-1A / CBS 708.71 / DSM 1257 / FGSC 987) TaxID=367110 RepID=Q7S983_NEUCR|nr:hypothetical protein NCU07284 [Neurospora crassa OR74A]EAA32902.1 hypothetical protein NCU07284 [Neurospora crassa OR74A]KHE88706.1 hypothetical protein GE21DRAFT_6407 [Neurospora crassa]|eukprot:XP_962138.1 hypothetical protein NCU07284 [Neurospora crassa OR74A]